jgi:YD repeat-containing protein
VTDPGAAEWQYTYNSAGLLATVEDPDQNVTVQNTYNSSGQVTQQEDGDSNYTYFSYTTTSSGLSETDMTAPKGGISTFLYGGGMLAEEIGPVDNATTYYDYNGYGEVVQETDPMNRVTSYGYDDSGDLTSETSDLGYTQYWTYDGNGNVLTYENADNQTTTYTYNSMDEVLTQCHGLKTEVS